MLLFICIGGLFALLAFSLIMAVRAMQLPAKMHRAEELYNNDKPDEAMEILKIILQKNENYVPAKYLRAKILMQKNSVFSISELKSILKISDFQNDVAELDIHTLLAELYHATDKWPEEIEECRIILSLNPQDIMANYRLGTTYYHQKKYREARDSLTIALTLNPALTDIYLPLGVSCYHLSDLENAEQNLLKATECMRQPTEAFFYLGLIYRAHRDFESAVNMFLKAKPDKLFAMQSLYLMGEIFFDNDDYAKAIETLEPGLNFLKPHDDESLSYRYLLAECYEMENKITEAVHHWEKIQNERPNFRSTQLKLEEYQAILTDENLKNIFASSLEELLPLITEMIARLNYNIVSKSADSANRIVFKGFNIKRINEPPVLILFYRTTKEIAEGQIIEFTQRVIEEKCKSGLYITTSRFSMKAKAVAASKLVELLDKDFITKSIERIKAKNPRSIS